MYFPRKIDSVLREWADEAERKPLVLRGARQTGKSSSVRELGRRFDLFLELNLERFEDLTLVRSCRSADELLLALAARYNVPRFPERTLLFLDEVQESPELISWLRFLREDHPGLFVVAAGSHLEMRLEDKDFSFPVGRVTFRTLHPLSFLEFLRAHGRDFLADRLEGDLLEGRGIAAPLHEQALALLRDYLFVGGMPEAVVRWVNSQSPVEVRGVHSDLWQALAEDIQKYRGKNPISDLEAAFDSLKHHYGLRFRYENFAPGLKSERMQSALGKLEAALLIARVWPTRSLALPLAVKPRSAPKLLPLDVGLALYVLGTGFLDVRSEPLDRLLEGRLAEIFVGQQLLASRIGRPEPLFFWVTESSRGNAETDYLLPASGHPVPVEVKSGASGSLKSLHQFLARAGLGLGIRFSTGPLPRREPHRPDAGRAARVPSPLHTDLFGGGGPERPSRRLKRPHAAAKRPLWKSAIAWRDLARACS